MWLDVMESFYPHLHARCTQKRGELMRSYDIDTDECRDLPQILLPNEVADYLCIHINTVYKLIHQGVVPAFRVRQMIVLLDVLHQIHALFI